MPKRHRPGTSATTLLAHIEEVVVATSGEDAFEIVFSLAAARILANRDRHSARTAVLDVARRHPELDVQPLRGAPDDLLARVDALLARAISDGDAQMDTLDAIFEALVPRVAKSDKGQFFTPRHVVDFVVRALAPRARELVVDPACGSGAFLARARAFAKVSTYGFDVDPRAIRVARLVALAGGRDPATIVRADGLHSDLPRRAAAHIVATNPPFAGRAAAAGFEVGDLVRTPERDVLFLERALALLREGGRLGIILPYNKAAGEAYAGVRRWLVARARVLAIVGLPRETFLPHTSQRTFVLFAKKRRACDVAKRQISERTMFVVSERAGKDAAGQPVLKAGALLHDLGDVLGVLVPFLDSEGFAS